MADEPAPPGADHRLEELRRRREQQELERIEKELAEVESYRMPLMEHLIELKNRLIKSMVAVAVGTAIGFVYSLEVFEFLKQPLLDAAAAVQDASIELVILGPFEGVFVWFYVSILAGLMLALPVVSYQVWAFVAPGLYRSERSIVLPLSIASVALFVIGAAFCYYVLFPYAFPFFFQVLPGVDATLSAEQYLNGVLRMMLAFGACFQLPVGSWFLARAGAIDAKDMLAGFRYAVVVIFVIAAIITPPDPLTQVLLALPMCLLYVVGIVIAWFTSTKKR